MSLRQKTLLIIGIAIIGLFSLLILFTQTVLLDSFTQLEETDVREDVQRSANVILDEIETLRRQNVDWSHWDDSYLFVQGQYPDFPEINLTDDVFLNNNINMMLFLNAQHQTIFTEAFNLQAQRQIIVPHQIDQYLMLESPLFRVDDGGTLGIDGVSGIVMLDNTPMLISSTPILPSDLTGEAQGSLIWGRFLNDAALNQIQEQTRVKLTLETYDPTLFVSDIQTAPTSSKVNTQIIVQAVDESRITGSMLFYDIFGEPAFVLRLQAPREIYGQGRTSIFYFTLFLIGACALLTIIILLLLEKAVLSPLARLNTHVSSIRNHSDWAARVIVPGKDEVGNLAQSINQMLETVTQSRKQTQQAKDDAALRERILKTMSHDVRAPLAAISLYAEMLQRGLYGEISIKQSEAALTIYASAQQLLRFVDNLLEEAQLSVGKLSLHETPFEIAELVRDVEMVTQPLAAKKHLTLKMDVVPELPPILFGDMMRIHQILINVITNSIKYTDAGEIKVCMFMPNTTHWTLQVSDTGVGIPKEALDHIFDPFWQMDDTKTRQAMLGVGLGLSIVKQLAELMRGEINVVSEPEHGTVFTVTLPMKIADISAVRN